MGWHLSRLGQQVDPSWSHLRTGPYVDIYMSDSVCLIASWDLFPQFMDPKRGLFNLLLCDLPTGKICSANSLLTGCSIKSPSVSRNVKRFIKDSTGQGY